MSAFSERLQSLRVEANLSLTELSFETRIPEPTLRTWESGRRAPSDFARLGRLAKFFGLTIDDLLADDAPSETA